MLNLVIEEIKKAKNYSAICEDVILRICNEELPKYKKSKDVIKSVKKKLHTINNAFLQNYSHKVATDLLQDIDLKGQETTCDSIMRLHSSTNERINELSTFYSEINAQIGAIDSIIDIGCGFNPFSLPWMQTKVPLKYFAYDINLTTIDLINKYFKAIQLDSQALPLDIISRTPSQEAHVAFLFKLLPLIEQQKKGLYLNILTSLNVEFIIVTFPIISLSGIQKGMKEYYSNWFENGINGEFNICYKNTTQNELIYIISKRRKAYNSTILL